MTADNHNNNNGGGSDGGPRQPKAPKVSMCPRLQKWFLALITLWCIYFCYMVSMTMHVQKKASPPKNFMSLEPPTPKNTKISLDNNKNNGITVQVKEKKNNDVKNLPNEVKDKIQELRQKMTQSKGNEEKQEQPKEVPKEKPKMKRPGFKPEPYGHMVEPQALLLQQKKSPSNEQNKIINRPQQQNSNEVLKAYLEPIDQSTWDTKPFPARDVKANDLTEISYPKLNSCTQLPAQWPIDDYPDADPYLPWIHDVFPTHDGKFIQFVAQNKRRCHTGTTDEEEAILEQMAPQSALFQHVAVQRVTESSNNNDNKSNRYRLSSHHDADPDGIATRYICRYKPSMEETLSVFNHDYEWASYRKRHKQLFTQEGRDNKSVLTSQLMFQCPVPDSLVDIVKSGNSVSNDWASLFLDLIPIRTPPRWGHPSEFLQPKYMDSLPNREKPRSPFNADEEYGTNHILPKIEDSGRWENIPICKPSLQTYAPRDISDSHPPKKHHLVSCLWASTGYTTRGNRYAINDGQRRLIEWITFNKILGFDHFYIYDNSGAFSNETTLQPVADIFPNDVTIIPWPSRVCNNNPNNVDSVGERSSQYAAESSCRLRFGPYTKWIGQFDIDEYLIPMGNFTGVLPLLEKLDKENTKIISFASWRAWPRRSLINDPQNMLDARLCGRKKYECFELSVPLNTTVLQTYNCDRFQPGKKKDAMPAEKQLYRADYVKQHFVHYSTVTASSVLNYQEYTKRYGSKRVFPDPNSRFGDEVSEALMIHSKAIARQDTTGWQTNCHKDHNGFDQCRIGFPWPGGVEDTNHIHNADGWKYNCFVNEKVEKYWVPKLEQKLAQVRKENNIQIN